MNFLFKVIICFLLINKINISAVTLVDKELTDFFTGEEVSGDFTKTILKETSLSEYGKNVVFKDACTLDDGYVVVGGSVRMGEAIGGMDALVVKYTDNEIEWFKVFGGVNKDVFTSVNCESGIVLGGYTYKDNFKSGLMASLTDLGEVNWVKEYSSKLDVNLTSVDYNNDYYFTGYIENFESDNDFFILRVNKLGEITKEKIYSYTKDDRINDILISDYIYLVGSTDSNEFDVLGQRGILLKLDFNLDIIDQIIYNSSDISLFNSIEMIDYEVYITGTIGKNEALEFSDGVGFIAKLDNDLNVELKSNYTEVNGVYKIAEELIPYGVKYKKDYIPIIDYKDEIELSGKGEVVKVIESNGLKTIHTNIESTNIGVITDITHIVKENDKIYVDNKNMILEERYIDDLSNNYGEYKKYKYLKYNDIKYYGDLETEVIEFYTNIDKEEYYDTVTLYFNGTGYLNGLEINSGFILKELGEYQLRVVGVNNEEVRNFILKTRTIDLNYYDNYNYTPLNQISFNNEKKDYSIFIGITLLIIISVLWYIKRRN